MEDLQIVEHVVRKDPKVIEQCGIVGIPKEDMHKVYCDRESNTKGVRGHVVDAIQRGQLASMSDSGIKSGYSKL
jgi:Cu2+-containing amine oxidase